MKFAGHTYNCYGRAMVRYYDLPFWPEYPEHNPDNLTAQEMYNFAYIAMLSAERDEMLVNRGIKAKSIDQIIEEKGCTCGQ